MAKAYFMVRSIIAEPLRPAFDQWYSSHHVPLAIAEFRCEKSWRFWSVVDPGAHYAMYRFADMAQLDATLKSKGFKRRVADFDQAWPSGVTRMRDLLSLAEERAVPI